MVAWITAYWGKLFGLVGRERIAQSGRMLRSDDHHEIATGVTGLDAMVCDSVDTA
jgi:hypothetical protein